MVEPLLFSKQFGLCYLEMNFPFWPICLAHGHYFPLIVLGIFYHQLDLILFDEVEGVGYRIVDSPINAYFLQIFLLEHVLHCAYLYLMLFI